MILPGSLLQKVQYDYVSKKYRNGEYVVQSLGVDLITSVLQSFFEWAETESLIVDSKVDISRFTPEED